MNKRKKGKIPILSFYSGGGFLDMGFEMANFKIVWSNEYDSAFADLHSAGITSWRNSRGFRRKAEIFNKKSIKEISSAEIILEAFPKGKPEFFGVIGGPPCQDFSVRGNLQGFDGERGKLTVLYLNKIMELQPTFFVMENVTGLIKVESHKELLTELLEEVKTEYHIDHTVLNAIEFGVPQSRERVFFIGIRKKYLSEKILSKPSDGWFTWPIPIKKYKNAEHKYEWPLAVTYGSTNLVPPSKIPPELFVECCLVPVGKESKIHNAMEFFNFQVNGNVLRGIKEGETNRPSFKRLHRFKFSPTACYGNNEVHLHPYQPRRLSVRETLRIQGVPDTYILPPGGSLSKKFKLIGNGVPVPLAKAVANALKKFMAVNKIIS